MIHCMAHAPPANRWKLAVMQNFKSLHTVMIKYKPSQWKTKTKVWWSEHQYYLRKLQILSDSSFGVGGKGQPSLEREEELEREERALDAVWLMALDSVALSQLRTLRLRLCLDGCSRWWAVQTCRRNASRTFPTCCWNAGPCPHQVSKKLNPYTSNIWATDYEEDSKAYWVTKGTVESNSEQILETQEACFWLSYCHVVPAKLCANHP